MSNGDIMRTARALARKVKRRLQFATTPGAEPAPDNKRVPRARAESENGHGPKTERARRLELDGLSFVITQRTAKVTGAVGGVTSLYVPDSIEGIPVTTIGKEAFAGNRTLRTVTIPESVTLIGSGAFASCTSLQEVDLPSHIEVINARTFEGCTSLKRVWLPYDVQRIAERTFAGCLSLEELPHYIRTGISVGMKVDRSLTEHSLPTELKYIGAEAFQGCSALRKIVIPFRTSRIRERTFQGCVSLEVVWLHAQVTSIDSEAFAGCASLGRIAVPVATEQIGRGAFDETTVLVCQEGSPAGAFAAKFGLESVTGKLPDSQVHSQLGAVQGTSVAEVLASPELTQAFLDRFEVRPAAEVVAREAPYTVETAIPPSRFELRNGAYCPTSNGRGGGDEVTIAMVGDLMGRFRQQESALDNGMYDFSASFEAVAPLLRASDLSVGNLETMVSPSMSYMHEERYIEDRPHLNAPFAFAAAVREAGFDAVMNAQNHMYDAGTRGVLETLDSLNRAELIRNGMYASSADPRFVLFKIKGISIGIVSFVDGARQKMKQANFTNEGLATIAGQFSEERVRTDIAAAREAGAEFVLAYAHWGREYTDHITQRQQRFARLLVDGGADYVFGAHSHCPQPYTKLTSSDGRSVPVIYSGGNFVSDIGLARPITQDSFIAQLTLRRGDDGAVVVERDGYVPCRIIEHRSFRGLVKVVPCEILQTGEYGYDKLRAEEDVQRISAVLGRQYTQLSIDGSPVKGRESTHNIESDDDELVDAYALREPDWPRQVSQRGQIGATYALDEASGHWRRAEDTAIGEAILLCGGSVLYDSDTERSGDVGETHQFRSAFRHARAVLDSADLAVGSFGAVVADMYPAMSLMTRDLTGGHYANARPEFLDALLFAGFDCLALANPYNLDAGVRGVSSTERTVVERGMVPSGLGRHKHPIFDVNGIKIAVLSFTVNEYRVRTFITDEGADAVLNIFDDDRARRAVESVRASGAEFVLMYLDCRATGEQLRFADRLDAGRRAAEAGADYVVCTLPHTVSKHRVHTARDGRRVPIATGIGTFMSSPGNRQDVPSALLRLSVRRGAEGAIAVVDSYVPLKRFRSYGGSLGAVAPAAKMFNSQYDAKHFVDVAETLAERLGDGIEAVHPREIGVNDGFQPQLSPAQISDILGVPFSADSRAALGGAYDEAVFNIVARRRDLRRNSVAAFIPRPGTHAETEQIRPADATEAGAAFAISTKPEPGIPTLIVDDVQAAYLALITAIRDKYSPITVAITGTVGKTTAKELMTEVFLRHYRTLSVKGNNNTVLTSGMVVQKLSAGVEAYVQEVHGGSPQSAKNISRAIRPHVALITAVGDGHLGQMGTIERVIEGKMEVTSGLRPGGVLVINNDNEHLRRQAPSVTTIRYSVSDERCDYTARNIRDLGDRLEFQIVAPDGVFDAALNFQGLHNVSNAVGVFAASRAAGVPPHKIIAGMSRFVPDTVRQNLVEVGGYQLLIDTYSSTPMSVISSAETLCALPLLAGARRIVVVGDMPDLGEKSCQDHAEVGEKLAEMNIDLLLCVGEESRHLAAAARAKGADAHFFSGRADFNRLVAETIRPGDLLLFKGGTRVKLLEDTVYPLFGHIV